MFVNKLPLNFDSFDGSDENHVVTLKIEKRKAKLADGQNASAITQENCWRYIIEGGREDNNDLLETFIGPVINVKKDVPLTVTWQNTLQSAAVTPHSMGQGSQAMAMTANADLIQEMPPINMPLMSADMNPSVGVVSHLHGGKVKQTSDGWPLTPVGFNSKTPIFPATAHYCYPNNQRAGMLWFHDHAMDNTAPQVYAGLAGLYFIRDDSDDRLFAMLGDKNMELPLVIQDRVIDCDYCCMDYRAGIPTNKGFERPEFLGDSIFVNGRAWPHHELEQKRYRLRVLNGSNARTYALALINPEPWNAKTSQDYPKIWYSDLMTVIGNDAGLYPIKQTLKDTDYILIAPGQRLDILLDATALCPDQVRKLRLVNLAVASLANGDYPEAIFQNETNSILKPTADYKFLSTLLAIKQANILQFCLKPHLCSPSCACADNTSQIEKDSIDFNNRLDSMLIEYAEDDGFKWDSAKSTLIQARALPILNNRFVVLMNNTRKLTNQNPYTKDGNWHDTQIWEMGAVSNTSPANPTPFYIPFQLDFNSASGSAVNVGSPSDVLYAYQVQRSTFFDPASYQPITDKGSDRYSQLAPAVITPVSGSYERWYVANLGNWQATDSDQSFSTPDMHPFHIHLVNFVVTRRFVLKTNGNFVEIPSPANTYDGQIRADTVRIHANELVELLVYFPEGFEGNQYPYHCHLVEHEDMGMMLYFELS